MQENLNLPDRNAQLAQQQNPAEAADGVFIIDAVALLQHTPALCRLPYLAGAVAVMPGQARH